MLLAVAATGAPSQDSQEEFLPNFHQVNENLYRGGQPLPGGIQRLAKLGIKTVINLRDDDERESDEEAEVRAVGLHYFNVPMSGFRSPSDEEIEKVLLIINDAKNWPVFVHCHHGEDRTGTIVACYRISQDGWTFEQAKKEAKRHGMSRFQLRMKNYIKDYYKRWSQQTPQKLTRISLLRTSRLLPET
jgi:tyrosine-protein phosphatase SIW14